MPASRFIAPDRLDRVSTHELLEAAAGGYVGLDHRFLHAILDRPEESVPDLIRFALEDRSDPIDLTGDLFHILRYLDRPEALPFYVEMVRRQPHEVEDELVLLFRRFGAAALEPLQKLHEELGEDDAGDVPFLLAGLGVRDPRILNLLVERLEFDVSDAALCLEVYGDPAAIPPLEAILEKIPEQDESLRHEVESAIESLRAARPALSGPEDPPEKFDIWDYYPDKDSPAFDVIPEEERLALLEHPSAELRAQAATSFLPQALSKKVRARLFDVARADSEADVRGRAWEALGDAGNPPEIVNAMLAVVENPNSPAEERTGAVVGLAQQTEMPRVRRAVEELYTDPSSRAKALEAMWRSGDKFFAPYPPQHLDDPSVEVRRQAIWCVGYMGLSSEAERLRPLFRDHEFRPDALYCYALAVPFQASPKNADKLMKDLDRMAGGLNPDELETVGMAIDQRLALKGLAPVFTDPDEEIEDEDAPSAPAAPAKVGRNDPCPCGSGKKYKKCCGA